MTSGENPIQNRRRNPFTYKQHRRQIFWQIYLPLIVLGLLGMLAGVFAIITPAENSRLWADISLIFIIVIIMVGLTILLIMTLVSIYAVQRISLIFPYSFYRVQGFMERLNKRIRSVADKAVEPILRYESALEGTRAFIRRLRGRKIYG